MSPDSSRPDITEADVRAALDQLTRSRGELAGALDAIPEDARERAPAGRWSAAQILEHLARVDEGVAFLLRRGVPAGGPEAMEAPVDLSLMRERRRRVQAQEHMRPTDDERWEGAWIRLVRTRVSLVEAVDAADPGVWGAVLGEHYIFGRLDGLHWLRLVSAHEERHAGQLRELAVELGVTPPAPG
ncbi:MAG: DinB family protein [Gemmatimonadota bacterium]|jgi:hypothetical protein